MKCVGKRDALLCRCMLRASSSAAQTFCGRCIWMGSSQRRCSLAQGLPRARVRVEVVSRGWPAGVHLCALYVYFHHILYWCSWVGHQVVSGRIPACRVLTLIPVMQYTCRLCSAGCISVITAAITCARKLLRCATSPMPPVTPARRLTHSIACFEWLAACGRATPGAC